MKLRKLRSISEFPTSIAIRSLMLPMVTSNLYYGGYSIRNPKSAGSKEI